MKIFSCIAGTLILLNAGCGTSQHDCPPHASWPKPVAAESLKQFEGVFRNHTFDSWTGKAEKNTTELFVFLLHPAHAHGDEGESVEIRSTADGNRLKLRLLDQQNHEIDSATLQDGVDFELSNGQLILLGPFSGSRSLDSNFGPGVTIQDDQLYLSATGDLLGSASRTNAMLAFGVIPDKWTEKWWMFWPKLAK